MSLKNYFKIICGTKQTRKPPLLNTAHISCSIHAQYLKKAWPAYLSCLDLLKIKTWKLCPPYILNRNISEKVWNK